MSVQLSPQQEVAAQKCQQWLEAFDENPENLRRRFFVIEGFAGTGKSFSVQEIIRRTGKRPVFMTYTGKAALVLRRYAGVDARTIHSTIYRLIKVSDETFKKLYQDLEQEKDPAAQQEIRQEIADLQKPQFELNTEAFEEEENEDIVLVLDECSMVDDVLLQDLLWFGLPIIALGDPGQLPPVGGEGALFKGTADARLTEILRQALDSPIIKWSMFAREQRTLPATNPSTWETDEVAKVPVAFCPEDNLLEMMKKHDITICWKNATRQQLNALWRRHLGRAHDPYPQVGDTIIITRNDKDKGIFNGQFGEIKELKKEFDNFIEYEVLMEDKEEPLLLNLHRRPFEEYHDPQAKDRYRPWDYRDTQEADYGYAITCHKSQGSQWDKVLVIEENVFNWHKPMKDGSSPQELRARWLYTAITRAAKKLTIVAGRFN